MTYQSRIPADPAYLEAIGRAFYNFTYLEWVVVWTIVKLSADGFGSVPRGKPASKIATALITAIAKTTPALPEELLFNLVKFHERYLAAIHRRNLLFHAHPYTVPLGSQQLGGGGQEWPMSDVDEAARFFEEAAIIGNDIFHLELSKVRP